MAERPPIERYAAIAARGALVASAACGVFTLGTIVPSASRGLALTALLATLALVAVRGRARWVAVEIGLLVFQASLAATAIFGTDEPALASLPVLAMWGAAALWRRVDHNTLAYGAAPLALGQGFMLANFVDGWLPELLLALTIPISVVATALVEARGSRRARRRLPAAAGGVRSETGAQRERRLIAAGGLGLVVLLFALGLRAGGDLIVRLVGPELQTTFQGIDPLDAEAYFEREESQTARRIRNQIDYGGDLEDLGDLGDDVIVEVGARRRLGEQGRVASVLLLGALHLDRFGPAGVTLDATTEPRADADDGVEDGWIEFEPGRTWALELDVRSVAITVGDDRRVPLFHTGELVSAERGDVRWSPRGLYTTEAPGAVIEYRVRTTEASPMRALEDGRAGNPGGFSTELPPPSPALERLRALSREIIGEAPDAGVAVQRVLTHFATGYAYSYSGSELEGIEGLLDFVERREGFCTSYASTATLLLRLAGVPARVVTGYRLAEYNAERALFIGRARDAHAWFEVHFEGHGWVPFDATPENLADSARAAADGPGPFGNLGWWLAGAAVLLGVGALLLRRAVRGARSADRRTRHGGTPTWFRELLRALANSGYPRPRARTPREFARDLERMEHPEGAALGEAMEVFYDEHYGHREASERERAALGALIARVRDRARRRPKGSGPERGPASDQDPDPDRRTTMPMSSPSPALREADSGDES